MIGIMRKVDPLPSPVVTKRTRNVGRAACVSSSRSETAVMAKPLPLAGYEAGNCAARLCPMPPRSARAAASVTPGFNLAKTWTMRRSRSWYISGRPRKGQAETGM